MYCILILILSVLFPLNFSHQATDKDITVKLPNGFIRGRLDYTTTQREFASFMKVPFATPPLGELRFQAPLPAKNWDGVLDTIENNVICFQTGSDNDQESEDCLYLNVYTTNLPGLNNGSKELLPVMFYIYGGGFINGGCGFDTCGPEFLIDHDVIIVTINYRIGPFGFLSTQDEVIPGNAGLKDQQLAIKWTHDNVHLFGGDPEKITIFGQSAGSASVTYQLLNKKNEGKFRGVIAESGSFLSPWAFQRRSREYAFRTAALIDDTFNATDDSEALLKFLLSTTARDIDAASHKLRGQLGKLEKRELSQGFVYAPIIEPESDDAFITQKMYGSLKSGDFVKVPILIGMTSEESITDSNHLDSLRANGKIYDEHLDWLVPGDMMLDDLDSLKRMGRQIRELYSSNLVLEENLPAIVKFHSDTSFSRSVIKHAEFQSQYTDVYFYQFSYDGEIGNSGAHLDGCGSVGHSEDTNYIWRKTSGSYDNSDLSKFPKTDVVTLYRIQKIFTDFAKTLNPTPERSELLQSIKWPKVTPNHFQYVDIDTDLSIRTNPKGEFYSGWNALYSSLATDDFDTY